MDWLKENWFKVGILIVLLVGIYFIYDLGNKNFSEEDISINDSQPQIIESEKQVENERSREPRIIEKIVEKVIYVETQPSNESTLDRFLADKQDAEDLLEIYLPAIYNNPNTACSGIVASRATKQHPYYFFLDTLSELETEYAEYETLISDISTNLSRFRNSISIGKELCESWGFLI